MEWLNDPAGWERTTDSLSITTRAKTDFWRITHDNGDRHTGHFFFTRADGGCELSAMVDGDFRDRYDQAGLMLRVDNEHWIKCGIEYVGAARNRSVVVTLGASDWSILPADDPVWVRLTRKAHTVEVSFSTDGARWHLHRQSFFPPQNPVQIGFMAASPAGAGFTARFSHISEGPAARA